MAWVVDTSVLLDIRLNDPNFGVASATCLARHLGEGLVICPVSYIEMAPAFRGDQRLQRAFLRQAGVGWQETWTWQDTEAAHRLWADHVAKKRLGRAGKRPVADVFIEAFTLRYQGLITRNPKHFAAVATVVP
jgi:predicted nucleic acid-binding protein